MVPETNSAKTYERECGPEDPAFLQVLQALIKKGTTLSDQKRQIKLTPSGAIRAYITLATATSPTQRPE
jgi:hypothetical protein